jgi:ABC-type uncharacterized transport system fused permease/ATPase subunit
VGTTFLLFTRKNGSIINHAEKLNIVDAQIITSGSKQSLKESDFDLRRPVKIIIHGFKGSGKDQGALAGVDAFLNLVRNIQSTENDTHYYVLCLTQQNAVDQNTLTIATAGGEKHTDPVKNMSLFHNIT